jgi:hypothetical protein
MFRVFCITSAAMQRPIEKRAKEVMQEFFRTQVSKV